MDRKTFARNLIYSFLLVATLVALVAWLLTRSGVGITLTPPQQRGLAGAEPAPRPTALPDVELVWPPLETKVDLSPSDGALGGGVLTEAYGRLGAGEYHKAGNLGQGTRVAIVDTQFDGLESAIAAGELPATLTAMHLTLDGELIDSLEGGRGSHGTACAEIVHDLAPEAELYLLQVDGFLQTAETMFALLEDAGIRIVSISMSVLAMGRADGTGVLGKPPVPVYRILQEAYVDRDMLIVLSAGNYARQHYEGQFLDLDGDRIHEVSSRIDPVATESLTLSAKSNTTFSIYLSWDDWGPDPLAPSPASDYDLYVYDDQGSLAASSTIDQAEGVPPVESVSISPIRDTVYSIEIHQVPTTTGTHEIRIWVTGDQLPLAAAQTPEGSLGPPADSDAVVTVGAVNVASGMLLATSSQGPTADGRVKPDVTSYAQVSVSEPAYGLQGFTGTSAAAPHIAGMAALLLEKSGLDTPAPDLREQLLGFAVDRGEPGPDNVWGTGIAILPPLGVDVIINRPEGGTVLGLDDGGRATLVVTVRRSDGTPLFGLGADAFKVALNGTPADIITVQDLDGRYVLRSRWDARADIGNKENGTSLLTVRTMRGSAAVPVQTSVPDESNDDASPFLLAVTPTRLYEAGDPIFISAGLEDGAPLSNARLVANVSAPLGRHDLIVLHDDGRSGDGVAADGVYGGRYPQTQLPGRYTFEVTAHRQAMASEVLARAELAVDVATHLRNEDKDGMPAGWERSVGLNYLSDDGLGDPDADGLTNAEEYRRGGDPYNWDTDGDWLSDLSEVRSYYRVRPYSADSDGGGVDDGVELRYGMDPTDPADDLQLPTRMWLPLRLRAPGSP